VSEAVTSPLTAWESFYVIVGSSAAALTGLQFVVMALVAERERKSTITEVDAFGTPTVVHFSAVLFVSAVLSAPWPTLTGADLVVGACGLAGVVYSLLVVRRARRQKGYQPVFEDWLFHAILPLLAYGTLLGAALALVARTEVALFAIAAVALLLLSIGIHNSWDTVTYIVLDRSNVPRKEPTPGSGERSAQ
jgi:hypothetical protein